MLSNQKNLPWQGCLDYYTYIQIFIHVSLRVSFWWYNSRRAPFNVALFLFLWVLLRIRIPSDPVPNAVLCLDKMSTYYNIVTVSIKDESIFVEPLEVGSWSDPSVDRIRDTGCLLILKIQCKIPHYHFCYLNCSIGDPVKSGPFCRIRNFHYRIRTVNLPELK